MTLPEPAPSDRVSTLRTQYSVVVLAEDDPVLRRTLSDFLAMEGFLVREVEDMRALRRTAFEPAQTLVLDVHLGEENIEPIVETLLNEPDPPNIVLISASNDAGALAERHGVQLLPKPFDLETLVSALLVPVEER